MCFCPSSFKHYSVYFCGTKDCQVVTDKYFCQIVVEKDDDPLVLQHVNECFLFLFYLILVFFFFLFEFNFNWLIVLLCMNQ